MGEKYYGIARGWHVGVCDTWDTCKGETTGYPGSLFKKFDNLTEVTQFVNDFGSDTATTYFWTLSGKTATGFSSKEELLESLEQYSAAKVQMEIGTFSAPEVPKALENPEGTGITGSEGEAKKLRDRSGLMVPLWKKYLLTVEEAAPYFRIGENKLRQIIHDNPEADFVLWNGSRALIKRIIFERYLDSISAI